MDVVAVGEVYYMAIFIRSGGKGIPGLSVRYEIVKCKGGLTYAAGGLIEDTLHPGVYVRGIQFVEPGQYRVLYYLPDGYDDSMETVYVKAI